MTSRILILLLFSASFFHAFSQDNDRNYLHNRTIMERVASGGQVGNAVVLGTLSSSPPSTIGDVYLSPDYRITTFWLYDNDQVAQGFSARLDLQRNEFDINLGKGKGIKALPGNKVRTLVMADSISRTPQYFVNAQEFKNGDGEPFSGFFQILSEGELTLLKITSVAFKPADHNPTHNTGIKDNRFMKKSELFYAAGSSANKLPGRKGILKLMESQKEKVDKFIQVNEINLGVERHLIALFDYYNSLTKM